MEFLLPQLRPGITYHVQMRATGRGTLSPWSPIFTFTTSQDTVKPKPVTNVNVNTSGESFILTWDKVLENEDGTPFKDFAFYRIKVTPRNTALVYTFEVFTPELIISYWRNIEAFGTYHGDLLFEISTVDTVGNESTVVNAAGLKAATPSPTNLTFLPKGMDLVATWTPPTGDVMDYQVIVTAGPRTKTFWVTGDSWTFSYADNQAAFAGYESTVNLSVRTRNSVRMLSEPPATAVGTYPRPNPPTGLTWVVDGDIFKARWTAPTNNTDNTALVDLVDYVVDIVEVGGAVRRRVYVTETTQFDFTKAMNEAAFLSAKATLDIEVRARNSTNLRSTAATAQATKALPPAPTGVTASVTGVTDSTIKISWTKPADMAGIAYYELYVANTTAGARTMVATVSKDDTTYLHNSVDYSNDHFFFMRSVDTLGVQSAESTGSTPAVRPASPFTVDSTPPSGTTISGTTPTGRATSLPSAISITWPAATGTGLAGYQIRYSKVVTPRAWDFLDIFDPAATSYLVTGLESATQYVFQVRAYDQDGNTSDWSAESAAVTSTVSEVVVTNISNSITVQTGGTIKSADYVDGTSGYLLGSSGLDIEGGTVNARVIKAGELRSTTNVTTDGTTQPTWSLNLAGNMSINDARVRGKIIVGTAGVAGNNAVAIQSQNYGGTGAQWAIGGDGTFNLKSASGTGNTARLQIDSTGLYGYNGTKNTFSLTTAGALTVDGTIKASGGEFYGTVTVNGRLEVYGGDAYVIARRAGSGAWVMLDGRSTTDFAINSSTGRFTVDYDGNLRASNAYFSGELQSSTGTIGGWTMQSNRFYVAGGAISLWNDGRIQGASFQGGSVYADTVRSNAGPGGPNSWCLQNDIAYRVWDANASQTVSIDMNGNATFWNLTANNGSFTGYVNATSGQFSGTVYASGGNFSGNVYANIFYSRTNLGGSANWIEIGSSGSGDYVDEIRLFCNGLASTIRNPSNQPGSITFSTSRSTTAGGFVFQMHAHNGFYTGGGNIYMGSGTIYGNNGLSSTMKAKSGIQPIYESALDAIDKLRPVSYYYNSELENPDWTARRGAAKPHAGFIAEEVLQIPELSHLVQHLNGEVETLDYHSIGTFAVKAIQELRAEVKELRALLDSKK